jgi:regulator of replication initiation timing
MKTLNALNYDDILGIGATAKYKSFTFDYSHGYVTLYYKGDYINTFMTYSNAIGKIKKEIKSEIAEHDINELLKMSLDTLHNFLSDSDIEKITAYNRLKNDTDRKHAKINKYLMNEIKEYFIYRLVRA